MVITIQEISLRRKISIATNTLSLLLVEVQNLLIIVETNMKNRSICHKNVMHQLDPLEIKEETATHIATMALVVMLVILNKAIKITNITTNRVTTIEEVTKVMEISNNKKTMEEEVIVLQLFLIMKTRLISK